jgi:hypothetical protein
MAISLHEFLNEQLGNKNSVIVRFSEIEQIAGEEWLLEVCFAAERLRVRVNAHPKDFSLAVIERDSSA